MDTDDDYQLALLLQEEYDREAAANSADDDIYFVGAESPFSAVPTTANLPLPGSPGSPKSIVDKEWELLDPNPDIRALFLQFNDMFFWGQLNGIEVKWSPRMTLCAGLCVYEGRGGLCSVRLSLPLLKLRPRKDLVETLLHEMIHAYLFVTDNNKDHDGHGPEFQKHMRRINEKCGSNITIYHTFHDEVDSYRQHWWRCNGPCQKRPPYFGFVKRAMNRAPSARDTWWPQHQASCGGSYTKIREPEGYGKKSNAKTKDIEDKKKALGQFKDIRAFMGPGKLLGGAKKEGEKERSKASSTVTQSSSGDSGDDNVRVNKSEKKNSVSSSKGHSSSSSKYKSDDHKSHKGGSSQEKHRHGSHSSSKDHKSSSKGDSDRHKSSDRKHSSSDSKKQSSSGKGSTAVAAAGGSETVVHSHTSKRKEGSSSSGDKPKKSNVHGFEGSQKEADSELGEPSRVAPGSNVHAFEKDSKEKASSSTVAFSGKGHVLGSSSDSKHKGDREKHKHDKDKHRHREEGKERSKEKEKSKKRPSEEGSSNESNKKKAKREEYMFGQGRTSKFRGDKPSTGIALNDPDDMVPCPVCATRVRATDINGHLDSCLGGL